MRKFNTFELNHLIKFGFDPFELSKSIDSQIPVEYITGKAEFFGNIFKVNRDTLIPRIETEELINIALQFVNKKQLDEVNFLDIGTGSGCIGISFSLELQKLGITYSGILIDSSIQALEIAKFNLNTLLPNSNNISISSTTTQTNLNDYNIIFANLPYIPTSRLSKLDDSVKNFEPISALDGGEDGLEIIRKVVNDYSKFLTQQGVFLLEVDDTHDLTKAKEFENDWKVEVKNDLNDKNRYWILTKKSN